MLVEKFTVLMSVFMKYHDQNKNTVNQINIDNNPKKFRCVEILNTEQKACIYKICAQEFVIFEYPNLVSLRPLS